MREIGEDPLEVWLRDNGFRNVDHAYAKYVNDTAETLYINAVEHDKPEIVKLVEALGLKIDKEKKKPTAKTIAAALDK
jgi:hypothetical protein